MGKNLPYLKADPGLYETTSAAFYGIDRAEGINDGAISDTLNMTSDFFPAIGTRKVRPSYDLADGKTLLGAGFSGGAKYYFSGLDIPIYVDVNGEAISTASIAKGILSSMRIKKEVPDFDVVFCHKNHILEVYGCKKDSLGKSIANTGVKWTPEEIFKKIAETEKNHPWLKGKDILGVADPSIWDKSRGTSVAETAERFGVYFEPGDNSRLAGWMQMRFRLAFDENGIPMMYVFSN